MATGAIRRPAKAPQGDTISVIFDKWTASQGQRAETVRKCRIYKRRLVNVIGDKRVRDVTKADVRNYVEAVAKLASVEGQKLVTAATVAKHLDFARAFFRFCARQDYCGASPAQDIQAPKDAHADDRKTRSVHLDGAAAACGGCAGADGARSLPQTFVVLVGVYTGARLEEICQLAPGNLELHGSVYAVRMDTLDGRKLKNAASRRVVPLPQRFNRWGLRQLCAAGGCRRYHLRLPACQWGGMGAASRRASAACVRVSDWVGPRLRFHSLRHSYADLLRAKKVPDDAVGAVDGARRQPCTDRLGWDMTWTVLKGWVDLLEAL